MSARIPAIPGDIDRKFSGRGTNQTLTEFINDRILMELAIEPGDRLVDIGCGDGTLLRLAISAQGAGNAVGLSGSEEEAASLRTLGLKVSQASAPTPSHCLITAHPWSAMECCTLFRPTKSGEAREIARISEKGARICFPFSANSPASANLHPIQQCFGGSYGIVE